MAFPPLGNSDHVLVSVFIDSPINSKQDTPFHRMAYDYSHADWDGLRDHLRDVPWEDIFKLSALLQSLETISNRCKRVLEAAKLAYATKTKESITFQKLGSWDFWQIVFSTKVNLLYLLYSMDWRCCLLHLIKQNYLLNAFPRTQIVTTLLSLYLFSLLELIRNCIIFL